MQSRRRVSAAQGCAEIARAGHGDNPLGGGTELLVRRQLADEMRPGGVARGAELSAICRLSPNAPWGHGWSPIAAISRSVETAEHRVSSWCSEPDRKSTRLN